MVIEIIYFARLLTLLCNNFASKHTLQSITDDITQLMEALNHPDNENNKADSIDVMTFRIPRNLGK